MRGILGAFIKILEKRHFVLSHYSVILGGESFVFYVLGSRVETFADRANTALDFSRRGREQNYCCD